MSDRRRRRRKAGQDRLLTAPLSAPPGQATGAAVTSGAAVESSGFDRHRVPHDVIEERRRVEAALPRSSSVLLGNTTRTFDPDGGGHC